MSAGKQALLLLEAEPYQSAAGAINAMAEEELKALGYGTTRHNHHRVNARDAALPLGTAERLLRLRAGPPADLALYCDMGLWMHAPDRAVARRTLVYFHGLHGAPSTWLGNPGIDLYAASSPYMHEVISSLLLLPDWRRRACLDPRGPRALRTFVPALPSLEAPDGEPRLRGAALPPLVLEALERGDVLGHAVQPGKADWLAVCTTLLQLNGLARQRGDARRFRLVVAALDYSTIQHALEYGYPMDATPLRRALDAFGLTLGDLLIPVAHLGQPELFKLFRAARFGLCFNVYPEPFGLYVLESVLNGCPVYTTGAGNNRHALPPDHGITVLANAAMSRGEPDAFGPVAARIHDDLARPDAVAAACQRGRSYLLHLHAPGVLHLVPRLPRRRGAGRGAAGIRRAGGPDEPGGAAPRRGGPPRGVGLRPRGFLPRRATRGGRGARPGGGAARPRRRGGGAAPPGPLRQGRPRPGRAPARSGGVEHRPGRLALVSASQPARRPFRNLKAEPSTSTPSLKGPPPMEPQNANPPPTLTARLRSRLEQTLGNTVTRGVLFTAEQVTRAIQRSPEAAKTFFDTGAFPFTRNLEADWRLIRRELDAVMQGVDLIPNFQDVQHEQREITNDDKWKTYVLYGYGVKMESNCARCPETTRLVESIPGMTSALFSILRGKKHIPPHSGHYKGVLRYHLGLRVPPEREKCNIRVGTDTASWEEGRSLIFDDTHEHEVTKENDGDRVVLFVDFLRPLPLPLAKLNQLVVWMISHSPYVRNGAANIKQWEEYFGHELDTLMKAAHGETSKTA